MRRSASSCVEIYPAFCALDFEKGRDLWASGRRSEAGFSGSIARHAGSLAGRGKTAAATGGEFPEIGSRAQVGNDAGGGDGPAEKRSSRRAARASRQILGGRANALVFAKHSAGIFQPRSHLRLNEARCNSRLPRNRIAGCWRGSVWFSCSIAQRLLSICRSGGRS